MDSGAGSEKGKGSSDKAGVKQHGFLKVKSRCPCLKQVFCRFARPLSPPPPKCVTAEMRQFKALHGRKDIALSSEYDSTSIRKIIGFFVLFFYGGSGPDKSTRPNKSILLGECRAP